MIIKSLRKKILELKYIDSDSDKILLYFALM